MSHTLVLKVANPTDYVTRLIGYPHLTKSLAKPTNRIN